MPDSLNALLPHRPPMLWIDALTRCTETEATATACFTPDHFAMTDGSVSEVTLIECVSQTVAAAAGHRARPGAKSNRLGSGMLVAVSNFRIESSPPLGRTLQIEVREIKRFGLMLLVSGLISCEGRNLASGELTLYA